MRVDYIKVAPDDTLSGPETIGTTVAKQSYALPARPDLGGNSVMNGASAPAAVPAQDIRAVDNSTLQGNGNMGAPVSSAGFLGAPQPLANGVLEGSEPEPQPAAVPAAPVAAPAAARAQQLATSLGQKYDVPGSADAAALQQRLIANGQASFITSARR
ncbi:Rare lipoprotein A precursor|nr:Rare lipoprotein A precursor [Candidatus Pantoea persica]